MEPPATYSQLTYGNEQKSFTLRAINLSQNISFAFTEQWLSAFPCFSGVSGASCLPTWSAWCSRRTASWLITLSLESRLPVSPFHSSSQAESRSSPKLNSRNTISSRKNQLTRTFFRLREFSWCFMLENENDSPGGKSSSHPPLNTCVSLPDGWPTLRAFHAL